jgi:hypothetical protein
MHSTTVKQASARKAAKKAAKEIKPPLQNDEVVVTSRPTGLFVHLSPAMKIKLAKVHKGKWDITYDRARNAVVLTAFKGEGKRPSVRVAGGKYDPGKYVISTARQKNDPPPIFRPITARIVFGHNDAVIQIPNDLPAKLAREAPVKSPRATGPTRIMIEHPFGEHRFEMPSDEYYNKFLPALASMGYMVKP